MKQLKSFFVGFIVLFYLVSCEHLSMEPDFYCINMFNKTDDFLYVLCRWDTKNTGLYMKERGLHKDSSLYHIEDVKPNYFDPFFMVERNPEDYLKSTDTLTVFILDKDEYEGKTWSQIVDSAHFRQIYHLSGDDIRLLNARVPYPPSEIMRNMDMVPSYEEAVKQ